MDNINRTMPAPSSKIPVAERLAQYLIDNYGPDAAAAAAERADAMNSIGDAESASMWNEVCALIARGGEQGR